ncbi:nucleotide disphospho-sugar-binding domain-containing protein [Streptomyces sp. NPDC051738]|uniref:nucleotide disphospho-sugar-binding domain-containing protein n=1 Tax=Streptomyces sp. NPDC051738 TaxID=3365672 RepID=UPI0037D69F73
MRVLMTVWPAAAHLYPVVPLAWALHSAGHEVVVASHPDMASTIASVGLTSIPLGDAQSMPSPRAATRPVPPAMTEELDAIERALDLPPADADPWKMFRTFVLPAIWDFHPADATPATPPPGIDDLVSFCRFWQPDLVIWDPCWPSAAVAAQASGAAHARLLWGLDYWSWVTERIGGLAPETRAGVDHPLARAVRPVADHYGVDVDDELLLGQWTIDPIPSAMRLPTDNRVVPVRWVPFTGTGAVPPWLRQAPDRPRVALSLGVSVRQFFKDGEEFIAAMLRSVADLDVEVVATLDSAQTQGIDVPRNVRTVDYVPLTQLLPSCSAIVHHGGIGTFGAASAMRVPQLVTVGDIEIGVQHDDGTHTSFTAKHMDAPPTSQYVLSRGAGLVLDRAEHSVEEMSKRLARVLNEPSFQAGADRVHEELLATPSPHDIVPLLERLTGNRRNGG